MSKQTELAQVADTITVNSGKIGIGTSSPSVPLHIDMGADNNALYIQSSDQFANIGLIDGSGSGKIIMDSGELSFTTGGDATTSFTGSSERMRIDASGNVGIGVVPESWYTPLSTKALQLGGTTSLWALSNGSTDLRTTLDNNLYVSNGGVNAYLNTGPASRYQQINGTHRFHTVTSGTADATATVVERMRVDASGRLLHGKTTSSETVLGTKIELNSGGGRIIVTGSGGTGGALFLGNDTTGNVGLMRENGDFESKNNSYTGFSDVRLKENIEDSGSQWEDIKALRVCKFSFIQDQLDAPNKIGLIAQELEETGMSGLVSTNPDLSNPDETIKTVKYSILYMKAVKALQEAMERIETLEAEQTTIKARLDAQETP